MDPPPKYFGVQMIFAANLVRVVGPRICLKPRHCFTLGVRVPHHLSALLNTSYHPSVTYQHPLITPQHPSTSLITPHHLSASLSTPQHPTAHLSTPQQPRPHRGSMPCFDVPILIGRESFNTFCFHTLFA